MEGRRCVSFFLLAIVFLKAHRHSTPEAYPAPHQGVLTASAVTKKTKQDEHFFSIARTFGTDKVDPAVHHYHNAYQWYLTPLRHTKVKFLEIGLGCDMAYGPGRSARLWNAFFTHTHTEIWEAEVDSACASRWNNTMKNRILTGDQGNPAVLKSWSQQTGGGFDIIIDDGGHSYSQQLQSLNVLFKYALKDGGIYFMEDLITSTWSLPLEDGVTKKTSDQVKDWMDDLMLGEDPNRIYSPQQIENLQSIECFRGMCAFHKCPVPVSGAPCP